MPESIALARPILFQGAMVRALLAGTKTQTRRAVKWRGLAEALNLKFTGLRAQQASKGWVLESPSRTSTEWRCDPTPCPYGIPGDQLWVKETWRAAHTLDELSPMGIAEKCIDAGYNTPWAPLAYEADGARNGAWRGWGNGREQPRTGKTRVSIHMPRWASRIRLEVTEVRVERLQVIGEEDCVAEGCITAESAQVLQERHNAMAAPDVIGCDGKVYENARAAYRALWDSINGKTPGAAWADNPWVWVVTFRKIKP